MYVTLPKLRAIVFAENGSWVAQCLEVDVAAYGKTLDSAAENLRDSLLAQARLDEEEGRKPFEGLSKAPEKFWKRFDQLQWRRQVDIPDLVEAAPPPWMLFALESETLRR